MLKYDPKVNVKEIEYTDFGFTDDMKSGFGYNGEVLYNNTLIYGRARYYHSQISQFFQ